MNSPLPLVWVSPCIPGTPPSINELPLDSRNPRYRRSRNQWQQAFGYAFQEAGNVLPRPLATVRAQAMLSFPVRRGRDEGNYRAHLEKWVGDVLQHTHRLDDDTPEQFTFGAVTFSTGAPSTTLLLQYTLPEGIK